MCHFVRLMCFAVLGVALSTTVGSAFASSNSEQISTASTNEDASDSSSIATVFHFDELLSGTGAPEKLSFATLTVREQAGTVLFELSAQGLDQFVGTPFVRTLAIKTKDDGGSFMLGSVTNAQGVNTLTIGSGGGPGGSWDGQFVFGKGASDRFTDNEVVSWVWVGGAGHWEDFALHVQGISYRGTTSAWYEVSNEDRDVPPPPPVMIVPEPGTYALFAGGLLAVCRRQRTRRQST